MVSFVWLEGQYLVDKSEDVGRGQITEDLECPAKDLKFLLESVHGAWTKVGCTANGLI